MIDGGLVVGIEGEDKTGKTTLALSFDQPIYHIDLDVGGFRRASVRYLEDIKSGGIVSKRYVTPQQAIRTRMLGGKANFKQAGKLVGMKELWYEILTDVADAAEGVITNPHGERYNTIVVDSFAQMWELCQLGYLQEKQERQREGEKLRESLQQIEYSEPNARMRTIIQAVRNEGLNLVLTHNMKDDYQKMPDKDGRMVDVKVGIRAAGWKYVGKESDVIIRTDTRKVKRDKQVSTEVFAKVVLCGMTLELTDVELSEPTAESLEVMIRLSRGEA